MPIQKVQAPSRSMDTASRKPGAAATDKSDTKSGSKTEQNAQSPNDPSSKSTQSTSEQNRTTTGQGAAGSAKLTTEQRTKISSVIKEQKVERVNLNVSVSVGTRIPTNVRLYPLPQQVIVIYPEWRATTTSWSATRSSSSIHERTRSSPSSKRNTSRVKTIEGGRGVSSGCSSLNADLGAGCMTGNGHRGMSGG